MRFLEKNKQELEQINEILISKKYKTEEKTLALCQQLDKLMDFMNIREKEFKSELSKMESESISLKLKLESLVSENKLYFLEAQHTFCSLVY